MNLPMWFIGIQVTFFSLIASLIGVFIPWKVEKRLKEEARKRDEILTKKQDDFLKDFETKYAKYLPILKDLERDEEISNRYKEASSEKEISEAISKIHFKYRNYYK